MPAFDETPFLELGRSPIPGAAACGQETGEQEDHLLVLAELAKLDRIELGSPDWPAMEQASTNILRLSSKDLEIGAALGLALFKRAGYAGLSAWLGMTQGLVTFLWDGLFPLRPKRRKALIELVPDRFTDGGWFGQHPPKEGDFDALDRCAGRVAELEAALAAKMPDDRPDFKKFSRALKDLCAKRPTAPKPAADSNAATGATGGAATAFTSGEVADRSSALSAVLAAAAFMRKADPTDPVPYALVRGVKWSKIELPTSDAGRFQIDPPEASLLETLEQQFGKQLWEHLLKNAESAFRSCDPLWLDVQRYVAFSMRGLGAAYDKAGHAVTGAMVSLVRRLGTGLFDLKFKNGKPLCGGETRLWIESEAAAGSEPRGRSTAADNGKLIEASDKARQLAGGGKLKEALATLHDGLSSCSQRRERFQWRLRIAQLCLEAQRLQLAGPLLEECFEEVRRFGIDHWEPSVAVEVAQALYHCRKSALTTDKAVTPEAVAKVRESFAWLCQLDPVAALAAEPAGK